LGNARLRLSPAHRDNIFQPHNQQHLQKGVRIFESRAVIQPGPQFPDTVLRRHVKPSKIQQYLAEHRPPEPPDLLHIRFDHLTLDGYDGLIAHLPGRKTYHEPKYSAGCVPKSSVAG
jgi:hypothetical protein